MALLVAGACAQPAAVPNPAAKASPPSEVPVIHAATLPAAVAAETKLLPPVSTLPRPRLLWQAKGLWLGRTPPLEDGVLLAQTQKGGHVVALDPATGKERWRTEIPKRAYGKVGFICGTCLGDSDHQWLRIAGKYALFTEARGGEAAFELATGKLLWARVRPDCSLPRTASPDSRIGAGLCSSRRGNEDGVIAVFGMDLATGRERWRVPFSCKDCYQHGLQVRAERTYFWVVAKEKGETGTTFQILDTATGKQRRRLRVPDDAEAVVAEPEGRDLVLLSGQSLTAVRPSDGRILWSHGLADGFEPQRDADGALLVRDGRLLLEDLGVVAEIDASTGKEVARWPVPAVGWEPSSRLRCAPSFLPIPDQPDVPGPWSARAAFCRIDEYPQPGVVVLHGAAAGPAVVARPPGSLRRLHAGVALVDRTVHREDRDLHRDFQTVVEGYSLLRLDPPEASSLSVRERVREILERGILLNWETARFTSRVPLAELSAVPGYQGEILALLAEPSSLLWTDALAASAWLRLRGASAVLLRLLDAPMPKEPPDTGPEDDDARDAWPGLEDYERALAAYRAAQQRLSWLMLTLTYLDDPAAAARLGPTLLRREPEAPRTGRHVSIHASIYRMLARLGRPEDLRLLDQLEAATASAGGWNRICEQTGTAELSQSRTWSTPCGGATLGDVKMATSSDVWVSRPAAGGKDGPPAWAASEEGLGLDGRVPSIERGQMVIPPAPGKKGTRLALGQVFRDSDGDGVPDMTEKYLGTDPQHPDTDGDGLPDGDDPAPLGASTSDGARVVSEAVAYVARFHVRSRPLLVHVDATLWGNAVRPVAVVLHRPPLPEPTEWWQAHLMVSQVKVTGAEATLHIRGAGIDTGGVAKSLRLRRVDDRWRVVDEADAWGE